MFKPLRKKRVMQVIMWALIVVFAAWGAGSVTMTGRNYAGTVFNKKISPQEYSRSFYAVLNRAKMIYGDQLPKMQKFLNLENQAWDRLTMLHYAKQRRIKATNSEVVEKIASLPMFLKDGVFDRRAYEYIVTNIFGITMRDFEESVREDIIISKIVDSAEKNIILSEEEIRQAYKMKNEKADISYFIINSGSFKNEVTFNETELEDFYNTKKEQFRSPEKVSVFYTKIAFSEDDEFDKESKKRLAQEINDSLNVGDDFTDLVKKYNFKIDETPAFAFGENIPGIGLSYPFSLAAFGLSKEKPNNLFEDKQSFYIIKLKEKIAPLLRSFEQAKQDARVGFIEARADELAKSAAQNFAGLLNKKEVSLEQLSSQIKAKLINAKGITRESYADDIGMNSNFNNACFSINEKETIGPIAVEKGYAIARLDRLMPPDENIYQQEKDAFKKKLFDEKKKKAFEDWFVKLKEKANLKLNLLK